MGYHRSMTTKFGLVVVEMLILLTWSHTTTHLAAATVDCTFVTQLLSTCSAFIRYGSPDPFPGTPCCDAVSSLQTLIDSSESQGSVCRCLMSLIATYNPSSTALATLPGFCGVSLGFTIEPNTDCNLYDSLLSPYAC
ncbi:hypothetical protein Nepgr_010851 [Nepenthes gracilis]|uniref:Bifunctional inhibitor/plant lipid transfer protein/seed storage helical domain-containing protein n=1 Tax=Nepenthes gracilis TaxID=150966 RepID=A0AAD3SE10_NEPGR|nr:hypothetical protein Nepgr_010851 [Nepenthes gracilis]